MAKSITITVQSTTAGFSVAVFDNFDKCIADYYVKVEKGRFIVQMSNEIYTYTNTSNLLEAIKGDVSRYIMNELSNLIKAECSGWTGEIYTKI